MRDRALLTEIIGRAAAIKARIVAADEREGDIRRILNFGHTLGHALEKASHFQAQARGGGGRGHGCGVGFFGQLTGLSAAAAKEGRELLVSLGLPVRPPQLSRDEMLGGFKSR